MSRIDWEGGGEPANHAGERGDAHAEADMVTAIDVSLAR